jgi:hypothetical protein
VASIRLANLGLRFVLELALLVGVGWWGGHVVGWWAAVLLPLVAVLVWGAFLSPKARWTIPRPARLVLELVLFAFAAAGYYGAGHPWIAVGFVIAVGVSEVVQWTGPAPD